MKNLLKLTLAIVLVLSVVAFMFACGGDNAEGDGTSAGGGSESVTDNTNPGESDNTNPGESDNTNPGESESESDPDVSGIPGADKVPGDADEDAAYGDDWSENA